MEKSFFIVEGKMKIIQMETTFVFASGFLSICGIEQGLISPSRENLVLC